MDNQPAQSDDDKQLELAQQQALIYGRDLARVFVAEKKQREQVEMAYQALSVVFASTPDGLVVLNDDLVIQQANEAFTRLLELSSQDVINLPITKIFPSDRILPLLRAVATDPNAPSQLELTLTKPLKRSFLLNAGRLEAGRSQGWVIVVHDQTHIKRLERQKAEFINLASHELRTPLASVLGYTDVLRAEMVDSGAYEKWQGYIDPVMRGSSRLSKVVAELVRFAELNEGDLHEGGFGTIRLADLLTDITSDLSQFANAKNIGISVNLSEPDLDVTLNTRLLRDALFQLLTNAINFNKLGGFIKVEARTSPTDKQGEDNVVIDITDSGVGIPQTDVAKIFEPFFQVEAHETRHWEGIGLGLSIVQRSIGELQGEIRVESVLNEGTTFTLQFPRRQAESKSNAGGVAELEGELNISYQQSLAYAQDIQKLYRQLQQRNKELKEFNVQLEQANKLKSDFLSVISHELRTPFVSADFALQAIPKYGTDNFKTEQRELFDQLTGSLQNARRMIDNLIATASLLSKQARLHVENVDIVQLINDTLFTLRPLADRKRITLTAQHPAELVLPAGDRERLGEAIWHLTHNAIKFTGNEGKVTVQARIEKGTLIIEVSDTGVGIPEEKQAKVWESFAQLADSLKRGMEGLGLGLALVRYVAVSHGGNVILHSEAGVGSTIGFWIPTGEDKGE